MCSSVSLLAWKVYFSIKEVGRREAKTVISHFCTQLTMINVLLYNWDFSFQFTWKEMCVLSMHFFLNRITLHIPFYCFFFFFLFKLTFIEHLLVLLLRIHDLWIKDKLQELSRLKEEDLGIWVCLSLLFNNLNIDINHISYDSAVHK